MKYITTDTIFCIKQNLPFILVEGEMFEILRTVNNRYHAVYKNEIILIVKKAIADNAEIDVETDTVTTDCNSCDHIADEVYEALYNAGYRKTFTSDFASDTQKAFKEGYEKGCEACAQSWDKGYNDGYEGGKEDGVKEFAERLKRDSICTAQYEDGTKILTTSNKLIDQAVNIYMQTEGLI